MPGRITAHCQRLSDRRMGRECAVAYGLAVVLVWALASVGAWAQDEADLAATIDNNETYLFPAENVTYVITVLNNGPDAVTGAGITATFPAELTNIVWVATGIGGAVSALGSGTGNIADTADVPVGDILVYVVAGLVDPAAVAESLSATVIVEPPAGVADPNPLNNTAVDEDGLEAAEEIAHVRPDYANAWPSPNTFAEPGGAPPENVAAAYNGHVGDRSAPVTETQPRYVLKTSSFGQPLAPYRASPTYVRDTANSAYNRLFYVTGGSSGDNNAAAFRYVNTLYQTEPVKEGAVAEAIRRLENTLSYDYVVDPDDGYESDEERALAAEEDIIEALQQEPGDRELRNLLLDIYYYRTLGRQLAAKDKVVEAYEINFSAVVSADAAFGTPINKEIEAFETAAQALSGVLDPYKELLVSDMGVDITAIDPSYSGNLPFGYYLFVHEVPYRSAYAPTFAAFNEDTGELSGDPEPVDPGDEREAPVLFVTPTGFNVDEDGNPQGMVQTLQFTLHNYGAGTDGAGDLHWQAAVTNPNEAAGEEADSFMSFMTDSEMVEIRFPGGGWDTTLTSGSTPIPPGGTRVIEIDVDENNETPLRRSATIEVRDTSGKPDALTYNITVIQDGSSHPILHVEPLEIDLYYTDFANEITGLFYAENPIYVRNKGRGTLNWTAEVIMSNCSGDWVTFRNPEMYLDLYLHSVSGSNAGIATSIYWLPMFDAIPLIPIQDIDICDDIFGWGDMPNFERWCNAAEDWYTGAWEDLVVGEAFWATILISSDDEANPQAELVEVFYNGAAAGRAKKSAGPPLLSVYPQEITVAADAQVDLLFVRDVEALDDLSVTASASWLTVGSLDPDSGLVELSIDENISAQERTGAVVITASNTVPGSSTVAVTQGGSAVGGITVSPPQRFVHHLTGQAEATTGESPGTGFFVTPVGNGGPVAWTARVTTGQDWLSIVSGESGEDEGEILFAYDTNARIDGRTGEILIECPDGITGQNAFTVRVTQRGSTGAPSLTGGFKDLALLFDVMRDDAQVNKELARRYALRRLDDDVDKAYALIDETITRHNAALNDIGGLIPGWHESVEPNSDLVATYMSWQQAIEELSTVKDFLNGDTNILGFREDFLFLVQEFQGQSPDLFDSFDKLFAYMFDGESNTAVLASPLGQAYDKFLTAREQYANFVITQDQLREELRTQNLEHRKWMYDVIGIDPGNDPDNPEDAEEYRNPSGNYGGEIWMIDRSIDRARQAILQNDAEIERVQNEIQTELWRRSQEADINALIGDLYVAYGDQVATIEGVIGAINGVQEFSRELAEATSAESLGPGILFHGINMFTFAGFEVAKGQLEAQKARLAALENREVRQLEDEILEVNSLALMENLKGQIAVLGVQSANLALELIQQVGTRQANIDEWHYREDRMRENNAALLGRAFANPVHRLRKRRAMLEAEAAFKVAQRWVFFTIRALEYKWNTPFAYSNPAGDWSMDSLFRARTAKDLIDLMAGVYDFDGLMQGSARFDDRFDWFSFKKDFMGLTPVYDTDGVTELAVYTHPATGLEATATEVFQARLEAAFDPDTGIVELPFSTFFDNGQTFFRGPRRDPSNLQNILSRGQYLDKIFWMKVNLLGDFTGTSYERASGALTYSGGCYLRNARVGTMPDPSRPDVIVDEFTYWPTKWWFYDSGVPDADPPIPGGWCSSDEQTTEIPLGLVAESGIEMPDSVSMIDVFRERSVACDGWVLRIFTYDIDGTRIMRPDQIEDIEILFYHLSKDRPEIVKAEASL